MNKKIFILLALFVLAVSMSSACANNVDDVNIQNNSFNLDENALNQDNSNVLTYNQNNQNVSDVAKIDTSLNLSSNASGLIKSNSAVVFNVSLNDENGNPLNNSVVKLMDKQSGKSIGTIKVVNGTGSFSYVPAKSTLLDVYACYDGDNNYASSSSNSIDFGFTFGKISFMDIYILMYYGCDSIDLEYDITYNSNKDSFEQFKGIIFSKSFTIDGHGFEISGLNHADTPLGTVTSGATLTLKNVVLTGFSNSAGSYSGQVIHVQNGNLNLENATVKNIKNGFMTPLFFTTYGTIKINNCTFLNNAISASALLRDVWCIDNCLFINNTARGYLVDNEMGMGSFTKNTFLNNGNKVLCLYEGFSSLGGNYFGTNDDKTIKSYYVLDDYTTPYYEKCQESKLAIVGPDTFSEDDVPNYQFYLTNRADISHTVDATINVDEKYGKFNPDDITLSNKELNTTFTPVTYGNTTITVSSKYGVLATKDIEITKSKLNNYNMTVKTDDILYGGNLGVNVTLKNIDGQAVSEKAQVDVNGTKYSLNITNGTGFIAIPNLLPGNYEVTVRVISSNASYRNSSVVSGAKVSLGKLNINLTTSNSTIVDEYPINLTVGVTDSYGNIIANTLIGINDNGKNIVNVTTNDKGIFTCTLYPSAGSHNYMACSFDSNLYEISQSNQVNVVVNSKIATKLTLTSNTTNHVNLGDKIKFTVKLVDENNNPIANEIIKLYNNETLWANLTTDENGSANFIYSQNNFGILKVKAAFPVNMKYYSAESNSLEIAVSQDNSFLTLAFLIAVLDDGDTLNLTKDYTFNELSDAAYINGISIDKHNIIINGNGHKIDGNNLAGIFKISTNVTLYNLCITHAGSSFVNKYNQNYGAIYNANGGVLIVNNCTFENNSLIKDNAVCGAAICNDGILKVYNSVFRNNSVVSNKSYVQAGAIINLNNGGIANISNSIFENNFAIGSSFAEGGALANAAEMNIDNCIFINNYVKGTRLADGGAIYFVQGANATCTQSIFINNSAISVNDALEKGGAFYDDSDVVCNYNIFINNHAGLGSAVYTGLTYRVINDNYWGTNSNFENMVDGDDGAKSKIGNYIKLTVTGNNLTYTTIPTEYVIKFEGINSDKLPDFNTLIKLVPNFASLNCSMVNVSGNDFKVLLLSNQTGNLTLVVGPEFNNLTTLDIEIKQLIKKNYTINVAGDNFTCNDDISLDITLLDVDGKGITGVINYTFNNETKSVELKDGVGSIELGKLDAGNYTISLNYTSQDLFYNNLSAVKTFKVTKANVTIDVNVSDISYGENGTINVTLPVLADGNLTLVIKDILNKTFEVRLGKVSCILPVLNAGKYTLTSIYSGNDLYNPINVTTVFIVNKANLQLSVNVSDVNYGEEIIANVSLISKNLNLNATVTVTVANKNYTVYVINGKGNVTIDKLPVGPYDVLANYAGNSNINSAVNTTTFKVNKSSSFMNVTVDDVIVGNDEIIRISLPSDATGNITVIVDNKTYNDTVSKGSVIITVSGLDKGEHNLSVMYSGDKNYNQSSMNSTFVVKSGASNMVVTAKNIVYGNDLIVEASINLDATGNITFTVNNISQTVKIVDGKASATFKGLNASNYLVIAKYSGDKYYISGQANTTVIVSKAQSSINITISEIIENNPVNITATVTDGCTGYVNFEIPGLYTPRDKEIVNGSAVWIIAPLTSGEYEIIAIYKGDNNYLPSNVTKVISYNQTETILDVDVEIKGNVTIKANLTAVDGQKLTAWVYVTIKDNVYKVPVFNGTGYLNIGKLAGGEYNYSAVFNGTKQFVRSSANGTFEVPFIDLEVPYLVKYYSSADRLVAILTDGLGNPLVGKNITFNVNNVNYVRVTGNDGKASMAIGLVPGIYNVTASYGDIVVKSGITIKSTILANNITKVFRNGTQYYAKFLNSDGSPLANQKVTFNINGVLYYRFTGDDGIAKLSINLNPGEYILTAMHPNGQASANLVKVLSPLITSDLVKYYKNDSQFSVKVIKSDGHVAGAGEAVTFNINGVFYTRTTNDEGIATLKIGIHPGNYVITSMYGDYSVGNTVSVLPTLITSDLSMNFQDGSKFTAQTLDGQGKPLANQNVTFNVNGVFYYKTTGDDGIASLAINLMRGQYIITSMWNDYQVGNTIKIS